MSWNDAAYSICGKQTAQKLERLRELERKLEASIHDPSTLDPHGFGLPLGVASWPADIALYEQDQAPLSFYKPITTPTVSMRQDMRLAVRRLVFIRRSMILIFGSER